MHISIFLLAAAVLGLADASSVRAAETANLCKGLANEACSGNKSCSWVKSHKIKSGKEIAGFCRRKPTAHAAETKKSS